MTRTETASPLKTHFKPIAITASVLVIIFLTGVTVLCARWPFSEQKVVKNLRDTRMSNVQVGRFHGRYFPRPGCVLERVTFQHNPKPGPPPLITAQRITIEGSFFGLFAKRVGS